MPEERHCRPRGEGHFRLLDTVGDRGEGEAAQEACWTEEPSGERGGRKAESSQEHVHAEGAGCPLPLAPSGEGRLPGPARGLGRLSSELGRADASSLL